MQQQQTQMEKLLKVEFTGEDNIWLQSGKALRRLVGLLGMLMPIVLFLYLLIATGRTEPLASLSHYFFTRAGSIFAVILSLMAVFLILYKSRERIDFYISTLAGIGALIVVLFPTSNLYDTCNVCATQGAAPIVTYINSADLLPNLHLGAAAVFLCCLAYMALFLFTKSNKAPKDRGSRKIIRNRIYRICGVLMIVALLVMVLGMAGIIMTPEQYEANHITFWMETVAVESFGVAWFVKGETIFTDKK